MQARLSKPFLLVVGGLCVVALALAWLYQEPGEGVGSITVKLPPAHSSPRPGFKF